MSNKCRVQKIILVNWKGMFFQPFELDPGMTILEGANGTGKTTIMIAAYTCLMPDLKLLNFQNVTTVSARKNEDKGLYGRLGEGDLVYSLLDIVTSSGDRHLVGVQLVKKTFPQIVLKHFAIKNLLPEADIEEILTRYTPESRQQEILTIQEIGARALEHKGELINFSHSKDYFRFLYENGISPIRLMEQEERRQYNQLLHTSLYGGLSRSLQSSLRDYLLPEDNTLLSSIQDMEQNLLACRRTRATIQRYQAIREVIQSVYQTGQEMFFSAFCGARLDAEQSMEKALELRKDRVQNSKRLRELTAETTRTQDDLDRHNEELKQAISSLESSRERLEKCQTALNINHDIEARQHDYLEQEKKTREVKEKLNAIKKDVEDARSQNRDLTSRQVELAGNLSDAGQAWETLSKQVGLYQQVQKLLEEVRTLLDNRQIDEKNVEELLESTKSTYKKSRETHQNTYQEWKEAQLKQDHFEKYLNMLKGLTREEVSQAEAGVKAERITADYFEMENRLTRADSIPEKLTILENQIQKRRVLLERLKDVDLTKVNSSNQLDLTWKDLNGTIKEQESKQKDIQFSLNEKNQEIHQIKTGLPELSKKLEKWELFREWKKQLEGGSARTFSNSRELSILKKSLDEQHQKYNLENIQLEGQLKKHQTEFNALINEGTAAPGLKSLEKEGYGTLLANRYEDIPREWSANLEGRLGPLTNALVVKDIHTAADDLTGSFDRPDDIWLVEEEHMEKLPESREVGDSILVKHGDAWRFSRLPEVPGLGKKARQGKIEFLREKVKQISQKKEKISQNISGVEKNQALLNRILPLEDFLETISPLEQIDLLKKRQAGLEQEIEKLESQHHHTVKNLERLARQSEIARDCFPDKELLDLTDLDSQKQELIEEQENALLLQEDFQKKEAVVKELRKGLDILKQPPSENIDELGEIAQKAKEDEDRWRAAYEILQRLSENTDHFQYADQVPLLKEKKSITQHLKDQLEEIRKEQENIEARLKDQSEKMDGAERISTGEEKKLLTLDGKLQQLKADFSAFSMAGTQEELSTLQASVETAVTVKDKKEQDLNLLKETGYRLKAEMSILQENQAKADSRWKKQVSTTKPLLKLWRVFRGQAREEGKLERILADYFTEVGKKKVKPSQYWREESASRATLLKTMETLPNTKVFLDRIRLIKANDPEESNQGDECLAIWQQVRGYLNQVIPVELQTDDPEQAQETITKKMVSLSQSLEKQERSLREHVTNIPNNIHSQIRKQKSRIRMLNQKLETVKFGFLQAIQISIEIQSKLKDFL
ncbi:hypothetical protein KKA14_02435, partial [bacterium]|nr:hypothetical protein [bacterium]